MKTKDTKTEQSEKKGGEFPLGKIAGIAVTLVIVGTMCNGAGSGEPEDDGKKERPLPTTTTWRKAETKQEAFERVKARLSAELAALGLDASNIVANAKAHPTRLRGKVPEHARSRWLVLSTNDEAVVARRYVEECRKAGLFDDRQDQIKRICAMVNLFLYFEKIATSNPDLFSRLFSTHPMNPDRIGHVHEVLDEPDLHEMPQDS